MINQIYEVLNELEEEQLIEDELLDNLVGLTLNEVKALGRNFPNRIKNSNIYDFCDECGELHPIAICEYNIANHESIVLCDDCLVW